jgi:hypothetical protein
MNAKTVFISTNSSNLPNGPGAASILAAGIGSFMVAFFAIAADKSAEIKSAMIFYQPTGPLSGVTTCAILVWLLSWAILNLMWRKRAVSMGRISKAALVLLVLSLLLTFPPIADLL